MAPPRLDDKIDILHVLIDHVNNKTSLYNLCLVSKRFNYVFSKRLWRRLELDGSNMNCFEDENKRAILFQTPNLWHVKILVHRKRLQSKYGRLEYPQWDSELSDLVQRLPRLESIIAAEFDVSRDVMLALSRATCLKSLTLQFNQRTASRFFVKKEPGIESVWQSEMPGFAELRLRHFPLLSLTTLTRLTLLELSGHMGNWITWIVNILLQNEGLEHFSFSIHTPRGWDVEDNDQPPRVTFCFELCHKYAEKSSKKMKLRSLHVAWPVMFPDLPTLSQLTDPAYLEDIYMDDSHDFMDDCATPDVLSPKATPSLRRLALTAAGYSWTEDFQQALLSPYRKFSLLSVGSAHCPCILDGTHLRLLADAAPSLTVFTCISPVRLSCLRGNSNIRQLGTVVHIYDLFLLCTVPHTVVTLCDSLGSMPNLEALWFLGGSRRASRINYVKIGTLMWRIHPKIRYTAQQRCTFEALDSWESALEGPLAFCWLQRLGKDMVHEDW